MSHGSNTSSAAGKHPGESKSNVFKEAAWTGFVRSLIEPWLTKAAHAFGSNIPQDSWLRSETGVRTLGGLKQFAEEYAKHFPQPFALIAETATDFLDLANLSSDGGGHKADPTATTKTWTANFQKAAFKRMANAKPEDLPALVERLKMEFKMQLELIKALEEATKEDPHPVHVHLSWEEELGKLDAALQKPLGSIADFLEGLPGGMSKNGQNRSTPQTPFGNIVNKIKGLF